MRGEQPRSKRPSPPTTPQGQPGAVLPTFCLPPFCPVPRKFSWRMFSCILRSAGNQLCLQRSWPDTCYFWGLWWQQLAWADLSHQLGGNQDTLGSNPAAQALSAGRVTLSNQTQTLRSDCGAAATDIALALGHPLHRTGRARKRGFGLHSIFAKLFAFDSSLQFKQTNKQTEQVLGQKAVFPWQPWDIFRSGKILVGPTSISNYPLCYGRQVKCQSERNFSIHSAPKGRSEFRRQWELRTVSSVPIHEIKTEILNQLRAQLTKKKSNWKAVLAEKGVVVPHPGDNLHCPSASKQTWLLHLGPGPRTEQVFLTDTQILLIGDDSGSCIWCHLEVPPQCPVTWWTFLYSQPKRTEIQWVKELSGVDYLCDQTWAASHHMHHNLGQERTVYI